MVKGVETTLLENLDNNYSSLVPNFQSHSQDVSV